MIEMGKDKWLDGKLIECEHGFCETCGSPRSFPGAQLCNGCWEVESRLDGYLRDGRLRARQFIELALEKAKEEEIRAKLIEAVKGEQLKDDLENESDHAVRETPL